MEGGEGEKFKWTCESSSVVEDFLNNSAPKEAEKFVELSRHGLIETSAMFCNVTPLFSLGELIESLECSARLKDRWGIEVTTAVNHDVNGQSWTLPDLLSEYGVELLLMGINQDMARPQNPKPRAFWWEGYAGKRVLAWNGELYGFGQVIGIPRPKVWRGEPINLEESAVRINEYLEWLKSTGYPYDFAVVSVTNLVTWDNDAPNEELVRFARSWNAEGRQPKIRLITPREILKYIKLQNPDSVGTLKGEWSDWWSNGVGSAARETALKRWASRVREGAQVLRALVPLKADDEREFSKLNPEVGRHLILFSEHTWGSARSVRLPDSIDSIGQWVSKANHAYEGAASAWRLWTLASRGLIESLTGTPDTPSILVFNPLPWPVLQRVRAPAIVKPDNMFGSHSTHRVNQILAFSSHIDGTDQADGWIDYGLVKLPPFGYRILGLRQEPPPPETSVKVGRWELENRWFRIKVNPNNASISSLVSLDDGYEWVDVSNGFGLCEYVYHTVKSPNGRSELQPPSGRRDLEPYSTTPAGDIRQLLALEWAGVSGVTKQETRKGRGFAEILLKCSAAGVKEITMTYTLYDEAPWVDFSITLDKEAVLKPESVYIAFPFRVDKGVPRYASGGAVVAAESEQLPNTCRDFYCLQDWVDVSNNDRGVTLVSPDAPLTCIWGFTVGAYAEKFEGEPFIVSWPMNNYWWTNFKAAQWGKVTFRYRIFPHLTSFDTLSCEKVGLECSLPQLASVIVAGEPGEVTENSEPRRLPEECSLLEANPSSLHLLSAEVIEESTTQRRILLRVQLIEDVSNGTIRFKNDYRLKEAWRSNAHGVALEKFSSGTHDFHYYGRRGEVVCFLLEIEDNGLPQT